MPKTYFTRSTKAVLRHHYCKKISHNLDNHIFWGIRLEVLFRGFSHREIFQIQSEIMDLIANFKKRAANSGQLKEIVVENLITKPFKDEVI